MNPLQTASLLKITPSAHLGNYPEVQADSASRTVQLSDISQEDVGSSALAQLDALHALVEKEQPEGRRVGSASSSHATEGSEEALDDYMKRFMERMTGRKEEVVAPSVQSEEPLPSVASTVEVRQPARAPENSASLLQMRDVANASSRSAINIHQRRQLASSTFTAFLPAAAVSVTSTGLAILALVTGLNWQAGSVTLLVVALALAWRFWTVSRKLLQSTH
jgi:hypothetical protein